MIKSIIKDVLIIGMFTFGPLFLFWIYAAEVGHPLF